MQNKNKRITNLNNFVLLAALTTNGEVLFSLSLQNITSYSCIPFFGKNSFTLLQLYDTINCMKFFENAKNIFRLSLYSPIYILICAFVTYFSWLTGNSLLGMSILMGIICIVLIASQDILPILPCLFFIIMNTSDDNILNQDNTWPIMVILVIFLVGSFISHIISYPIKIKNYKLTLPLVAVSIALFMGGIGYLSVNQYFNGMVFILALGPCMLLIYNLIMSYTNPSPGADVKKYICWIMLVLGLMIAAQIVTYILRTDKPLWDLLRSDIMNVGWTNRNGMSAILVMVSPACFYLAYKNKMFAWFFYSIAGIIYLVILIAFCRGAILAVALTFPILLVYSFLKSPTRTQLLITLCVFAIVLSIIALVFKSEAVKIVDKIFSINFSTSGRNDLYAEAINGFMKNPMFGVGLGYVGKFWEVPDFCIYWFHSTIFQIVGNLGIVGIIAYAYFYFVRGKIMFKNLSSFNITMSIGLITFEIASIVNPETFIPFPFVMIVIVLTALIEYNNLNQTTTFMKPINLENNF